MGKKKANNAKVTHLEKLVKAEKKTVNRYKEWVSGLRAEVRDLTEDKIKLEKTVNWQAEQLRFFMKHSGITEEQIKEMTQAYYESKQSSEQFNSMMKMFDNTGLVSLFNNLF